MDSISLSSSKGSSSDPVTVKNIVIKMTAPEEIGIKQRFLSYMGKGSEAFKYYSEFEPAGQVSTFSDNIQTYSYEYTGSQKGVYSDVMNGYLPVSLADQCKLVHSIMLDLATSRSDVISANRAYVNNMLWCRRAYNTSMKGRLTSLVSSFVSSMLEPLKLPLCTKYGQAHEDTDMLDLYQKLFNILSSVKRDLKNVNLQPLSDSKNEKRVIYDTGFLSRYRNENGMVEFK